METFGTIFVIWYALMTLVWWRPAARWYFNTFHGYKRSYYIDQSDRYFAMFIGFFIATLWPVTIFFGYGVVRPFARWFTKDLRTSQEIEDERRILEETRQKVLEETRQKEAFEAERNQKLIYEYELDLVRQAIQEIERDVNNQQNKTDI